MGTKKSNNKSLHPRNIHNAGYNFSDLIEVYPNLKEFVFTNKFGTETIDFSNPVAVKELNRSLLAKDY